MPLAVTTTDLSDVLVLTPQRLRDERGHFEEVWSRKAFSDVGINIDFVQDNHSLSLKAGTLRGLHFQSPPHAQTKLVRCTRGAIYDVAVDVRKNSPTYGRHMGIELTPESGRQILIPVGFLHGFLTLVDNTEVQYRCSDYYAAHADGAVHWDSAGIDWPFRAAPIVSKKDAEGIAFSDFDTPFNFEARP